MSEKERQSQDRGVGAGTRDSQAKDQVDWDDPSTWPNENGGVKGPEPTRYGDWERNGRCSDF
ncbi:DUF1674 domain-containing protein [Ectothiorhodospiraceae bacterium WFHF3C12]|nr:DUF1674 domain-containing protein [Ectothiorhodospiraceae bacterium WFHF3C12]